MTLSGCVVANDMLRRSFVDRSCTRRLHLRRMWDFSKQQTVFQKHVRKEFRSDFNTDNNVDGAVYGARLPAQVSSSAGHFLWHFRFK